MMWLLVLTLALLFAYVDVWYFVRVFVLTLRIKLNLTSTSQRKQLSPNETLFSPYDIRGIVLPSDIDFMLHMNNSKYLREMDYGRLGIGLERGLRRAIRATGGYIVLSAASIRYRRSLTLFQRFLLRTRVICWEDDALYMEQRMLGQNGFVCAIMLAKIAVRGVSVPAVVEKMVGKSIESPPFPQEVASWRESIAASSQSLKKVH